MEKVVVLEVEDVVKRVLFDFHKEVFGRVENPSVLILPWTTNDEEKKQKYGEILKEYFKDLGAKEVLFLEENDQELEEKFNKANVLYIPGGSTKILLEKLNNNPKVVERIKEFDGIIIGNSAGAMILAKKGIYLQDENENVAGLNVVDYNVIVHFDLDLFSKLDKIKDKTIAIFEDSAVVIERDKVVDFVGRVLLKF